MTKANDDFYRDAKSVLVWSTIITVIALVFALIGQYAYASEDDLGYTRQVKCEQKEDGRQVQCWLVEVPNRPVQGIDTPFEDEDDTAD